MSSSVAIFGASGYIGLGIALAYRRAGYRVYGLVRNANFSDFFVQNEIEPVVIKSFDNVSEFADLLTKCSIIIDAIGYTPKLSTTLLDAGIAAGKQRTENGKLAHYAPLYIFTSGIMTYGDTSPTGRRPVDEMIKPRPQQSNKRANSGSADVTAMKDREDFENHVLATSSSALNTIVVRPGFVYGGQGGFVADLFYNEPLVIVGRRDMRWSWVHVDDLAEAYVLMGRASRAIVKGQLYNVAAPNDNPTYEELRLAMARAQGRKEPIEYKKGVEGEPNRWDTDSIINPAKVMNELGWQPRHVGFVQEIDLHYKAWAAHKAAKGSK